MANQSKTDKKDRNGGGDVTKATEVAVKEAGKTTWDVLSNTGPGRFSRKES